MSTASYVVLRHTGHGDDHYDLMLAVDDDGPLLTWRASEWPPTPATTFLPLPHHRRHYLTYEGEVGGGRGEVRRVASVVYECRQRDDAGEVFPVDVAGHAVRLPLRRIPT